jgi:phosphate ABC transporter, permease protein PstA
MSSASDLRLTEFAVANPSLIGQTVSVKFALDDDIDSFMRGFISRETPETERRINNQVIEFVDILNDAGRISYELSDYLFFGSASRNAEIAGIKGALIGSIFTLAVCLVIAFPLGVATAVYLEEIAPKNRITEIIEININNLAAVPSVVFGIMGLAIFIVTFGMPRSIPLVGGIVLALMTLPTIIISSRAAIRAVPPSIRDAALGVGASKMQTIFHHVIPLALPGMLTGTIIGMAQALGETAPLLMIGMVAFIVDIPGGVAEPATALPVQIFMWADFAERMFIQKTSAAIIVLLAFLITMNAAAIVLRKKLERRW